MEIKTKIDGKVQKDLLKNNILSGYVAVALGGISLVAYLIVAVLDINKTAEWVLLIAGAFMFAMGLVSVLTLNKLVKNAEIQNREVKYQLFDDYMQIESSANGEIDASAKLYYKDIFKIKESKGYIFVYPDMTRAFAIEKAQIPDIDRARQLLFSGILKKK